MGLCLGIHSDSGGGGEEGRGAGQLHYGGGKVAANLIISVEWKVTLSLYDQHYLLQSCKTCKAFVKCIASSLRVQKINV